MYKLVGILLWLFASLSQATIVPSMSSITGDLKFFSTILVTNAQHKTIHSTKYSSDSIQPASNKADPLTTFPYKVLRITQPEAEATVRDSNGIAQVAVELTPSLKKGDYLAVFLDGRHLIDKVVTSFQLNHIGRGAHSLQLQLKSKQGQALLTSNAISFYMHLPKVKHQS